MAMLNTPGATAILSNTDGTTAVEGSWYEVNPRLRDLSFQAVLQASSAGATCGSTVVIEVSNDGTYPLATKLTIALTNTTTTYVSDGGTFPSSMQCAWRYVRANVSSLTTSTAGSAGTPQVNVYASARLV